VAIQEVVAIQEGLNVGFVMELVGKEIFLVLWMSVPGVVEEVLFRLNRR